jgi:hypothetical protein
MNRRSWPLGVALLALLMVGGSDAVFAALGQAPSVTGVLVSPGSVPAARRLAAASAPRSNLYTVHETLLETGTSVLEYANATGVVFAVRWRGPVLPDLSTLLGKHFDTFKTETDQARALGKRGSPATVARNTLVLRSSGRMRNFFGYAYAPELIPSGVNIKDVLQ